MEFDFAPADDKKYPTYLPVVPVTFVGAYALPVGHALVDTGADITLLPMEMREFLAVALDNDNAIAIGSAGGGGFRAVPSKQKLTYMIHQPGFRTLRWKGTVFFATHQPVVLLGHYQCLDQLKLQFDGKRRKLSVEMA